MARPLMASATALPGDTSPAMPRSTILAGRTLLAAYVMNLACVSALAGTTPSAGSLLIRSHYEEDNGINAAPRNDSLHLRDHEISVGSDGIQGTDNEFYGTAAEYVRDIGNWTLTSLTAFEGFNQEYGFDFDGAVALFGNPLFSANLSYDRDFGNTLRNSASRLSEPPVPPCSACMRPKRISARPTRSGAVSWTGNADRHLPLCRRRQPCRPHARLQRHCHDAGDGYPSGTNGLRSLHL